VQLLETNPMATLAASARTVLDEASRTVDVWRTFPAGRMDGHQAIIRCLMEHANFIGEPSAVLFRKKDAARGFDHAYRQIVDLDLWFHLLEQGDLVYTREPLCAFRQHSRQQSARNDADGVAWSEHLMFASNYAGKPWMPREALFPVVYEFRRSFRKQPNLRTAPLLEAERRLSAQLGANWYLFYWMLHRLKRPFVNLVWSAGKRWR
jgi:hypothetical protein